MSSIHKTFLIKGVLPARVYAAFLDSKTHSAMTGSKARVNAKVGARFTAWDGYIKGTNLVLETGKRIVQSWRGSDWDSSLQDSVLELTFLPSKTGAGTKIVLLHKGVPDSMARGPNGIANGWIEYYFKPMKKYFSTHAS